MLAEESDVAGTPGVDAGLQRLIGSPPTSETVGGRLGLLEAGAMIALVGVSRLLPQ